MKTFRYTQVTSTQDLARNYLPADEIAAFVANSQTQSYGKQGRKFYSPKDTGIYFSVAFPNFTLNQEKAGLLTLKIATELVFILKKIFPDKDFKLKWVNDIYLNEKKIAGILTELVSGGLVVGVGINVQTQDFPETIKAKVGSITNKKNYDKNKLVSELLSAVKKATETYLDANFLSDYSTYSNVIGKTVLLQVGQNKIQGRVSEIDNLGRIVIERNGQKFAYSSGEISKLWL